MNRTQAERLEFWELFNTVVVEKGKPFSLRKASTDHWYDVALGITGVHISITLVNKSNIVGVEVYIDDNKVLFDSLLEKKDIIEKQTEMTFCWERLDGKKASRIKYSIPGLDFDDHSNYHNLMVEIIDKVMIMKTVFKKYI